MDINTPLGRQIMLEWTLRSIPLGLTDLQQQCYYYIVCLSIYLSKNETEVPFYIEDITEEGIVKDTCLIYKNKTYDIDKIGLSNLEVIQNNKKDNK